MKRIIPILLVVAAVASTAAALSFRNVMSREAQGLMAKDKKMYLLDVRTPEEFRQARLKGAVLIPINDLERRLREIPRDRPIMVYCAVGSRSNMVAAYLSDRGFRDVYNMTDGIVGWYRNGLPIER